MRIPQLLVSSVDGRRLPKVAACLAALTLASACGSGVGTDAQPQNGVGCPEGFPQRPIEMIVAYAAGGGTDVGARLLAPYLEEELGATVNVVNRPGGGGWVGWNELLAAEPDGHTIGFLNTPNLMSGYLNPELGIERDITDFTLIGNVVTDYGAIAIRPDDERFSDIRELITYAQNNRVTATSTGVGSDDQLASLGLNSQYGTKFEGIQSEGAADNVTSVLGGNIDVLFANVGEVTSLHKDGQLKAIAVMAPPEERAEFLPDVPSLAEAGYPGVESWSARGLGGPGGMPADVHQCLVDASARAIQNEEFIAELAKQGLLVDYKDPTAYQESLAAEEQRVRELGDEYVW